MLGQAVAEAKAFFLDTKLNLLLFAFPFAILSRATGWGDGPTLVFSMIALCPLAEVRQGGRAPSHCGAMGARRWCSPAGPQATASASRSCPVGGR